MNVGEIKASDAPEVAADIDRRTTPAPDAIDNRNFELLKQVWRDNAGAVQQLPPDQWSAEAMDLILLAMRKAGDESLFDQVTVKLERNRFARNKQ